MAIEITKEDIHKEATSSIDHILAGIFCLENGISILYNEDDDKELLNELRYLEGEYKSKLRTELIDKMLNKRISQRKGLEIV